MSFPEVRTVVSHTGRAEISTDPMGFELADVFIMLKPRDEWRTGRSKAALIEAMSEKLEKVPGVGVQFLQPIEMRVNELIAGARGDVAIKVVGEDYDVLGPIAASVAAIVKATAGAEDVSLEQTSGLPQLAIRPDRAAIARYGLTVEDINEIVQTAIGGTKAGEVAEGERRFDVVVRYRQSARNSIEAIKAIAVATPSGGRVPLSSLAEVAIQDGPAQVSREDGSRFVTVQANVRGRDVESFVEEAQRTIAASVKLPAGYNIAYGGQFENLQAASRRLTIVVPIALALIFLLLFQTFRSIRLGVMIFLCVPMAIIGGVAALAIAGIPFSISAGVGFIALFGIAVLNGIVMVAAIRKHQGEGLDRRGAIIAGAVERLRPVVTTAALAGFGFLPMLLAHGAGAEVQRPLAMVIIGGLVSSTLLTLFVLPVIYDWAGGDYRDPRAEDAAFDPRAGDPQPDDPRPSGPRLGPLVTGVVAVVLLLAGVALARAQTPLTLETFRARAQAVNPEIRGEEAALERRRAERSSTGILPPPEVFFTADEAPSAALTGAGNTALGIGQSFEFPLIYGARARAADLLISQAEADRDRFRRDFLLRTEQAYADLVAARTLLDLADTAVAIAERFARMTERRRDLGETNALEPLQASVALSNAQRRRIAALGELREATANVRSMMGSPPGEEIVVAERLSDASPPVASLADLEARIAREHPVLASSRLALDASRARERVVAYERYPSIGLEYSRQTVGGAGGYFGGAIRLGVPLWRWFSDGPDRAAEAETALRAVDVQRDSLGLLASLRAKYAAYETARQGAAEYSARSLPQAAEAVRIALRLFQEGEATYLEVLAAQSALIETQTAYIESLRETERLRVELEYVSGGALR
jgi:cobalt-zinc-cadmium resistance protein CzcA